MRQVIKNRKKNHPMKNDAFKYKSYSKFIFDINPEAIAAIPDSTTDSLLIEMRDFFEAQHLFMMESATERTFTPPYRDHEEIKAYKISGFSNPTMSAFAQSMQSFSFYDNQFDILGTHYINPIAFGGINRYLFVLEDTTFHQKDTTFTIYYRPRSGKSFDGLEGRLYINTNGFAIEKVTAHPYEKSDVDMAIIQEYLFVDDTKWFPSKLSTSLNFRTFTVPGVKDASLIGTGFSSIENIEINPDIKKRFNNNVVIETAEDANELDSLQWNSLRGNELTSKEAETYRVIDSVSQKYKLEKKLEILSTLFEGKVPLNKFNLDLRRVFNFNNYEGFRFGLGLETSKKMMKWATIGGYFGWANRDKEWKYGGFTTFHFNRKTNTQLQLKFQQDLLERGGHTYELKTFNFADAYTYRTYFITSMERQRLGEISFTSDIKANLTARIFGNYQRIGYTQGYLFNPIDTALFTHPEKVDIAETGIELKWNILEKYVRLGDKKVSQGRKFPSISFKASRGISGIYDSQYDYWRLNASVSQRIPLTGIGNFLVNATASRTIGEVPLFLNHVANGTGFDWSVTALYSFETMEPATFYTTEQAAFFTRFVFNSFKTKMDWNEPRISLHHAMGIGRFENRLSHNSDFKTMDKGYYEAGLIIDGLYNTLGLGAFYNYGHYSDSDWRNNITMKLSFKFAI